jgi:hypothetical protein
MVQRLVNLPANCAVSRVIDRSRRDRRHAIADIL